MNWLPAFAIALAVAAPNKEDPKKPEKPTIVGEWESIKLVAGGEEFNDPKEVPGISFEFTADGKFKCRFGKDGFKGTYTTDATKDPPQIDLKHEDRDATGLGIFKFDKDMLIVCFDEKGVERPTKFASPAGTRIMLLTFRRIEKKKD
jgi:uncharacterized protein (TIGR03067 family)